MKIEITGWEPGVKTISFARLVRRLGYSLSGAKSVADDMVARRPTVLEVPDAMAAEFEAELARLGVVFRCL